MNKKIVKSLKEITDKHIQEEYDKFKKIIIWLKI